MKNVLTFVAVISVLVLIGVLIIGATGVLYDFDFRLKKVRDTSSYEVIKEVEDTCRAMISSYQADKLTWEQYHQSDSEEKQSWAEQAKMRANQTASAYNEYILKNSFVWRDNIPPDIVRQLDYIKE